MSVLNEGPIGSSSRRVAIIFDCIFPLDTGGGERVYRRLAEELHAAGFSVDYLTRENSDLQTISNINFQPQAIWAGEIYDVSGVRTIKGAIGFSSAVYKYLRKNRNSYEFVLVSSTPVLNLYASKLALWGSSTRLIADWLEIWPLKKWNEYSGLITGSIAWLLQSIAVHVGTAKTVNSSFTASRLPKSRRKSPPVILGLVDLVDVQTIRPIPVAPDRQYFIYVGRHIADKQIDSLIPAMRLLTEVHPELRLVIVGNGPETPHLQSRVNQLDLQSKIEFTGRVSDQELHLLLSGATALVNPSKREGFGLVVVEAASRGVPSIVVSGDNNASVDLIVEGTNGFISENQQPEAIVEKMLEVISRGDELRNSTLQWYSRTKHERGMSQSVKQLLDQLS